MTNLLNMTLINVMVLILQEWSIPDHDKPWSTRFCKYEDLQAGVIDVGFLDTEPIQTNY